MDKNENVKNKLKTQNNVLYSSSNNKTDINNKDILKYSKILLPYYMDNEKVTHDFINHCISQHYIPQHL